MKNNAKILYGKETTEHTSPNGEKDCKIIYYKLEIINQEETLKEDSIKSILMKITRTTTQKNEQEEIEQTWQVERKPFKDIPKETEQTMNNSSKEEWNKVIEEYKQDFDKKMISE